MAAAAVLVWVLIGLVLGFTNSWDNVLFIVSSSVTLVMVFAIQHTQARQQSATQRKLDELLRALPTADHRLIAVCPRAGTTADPCRRADRGISY